MQNVHVHTLASDECLGLKAMMYLTFHGYTKKIEKYR